MQYFIIFKDRVNLNLPKNSRMEFGKAISALNRNNNKLLRENLQGQVYFEITDINGQTLVIDSLVLPKKNLNEELMLQLATLIPEEKIIKELQSSLPNSPSKEIQEQQKELLSELQVKESTPKKNIENKEFELIKKIKQTTASIIQNKKAVVSICLAVTGLLLTSVIITQNYNIKNLEQKLTTTKNEVSRLSELQQTQFQLDTFSRYFITRYYSGNKELISEYMDKKVYDSIQAKNGTISSLLLNKVEYKKNKVFEISYILGENQDGNAKTYKIILKVKSDSKAKHDFVVITKPSISEYTF